MKKKPTQLKRNPFQESISQGYESSDVSISAIKKWAIGLFLMVIGVQLTLLYWYDVLNEKQRVTQSKSIIWSGQPVPPVEIAALEIESGKERERIHTQEVHQLTSYGWINLKEKIAHIPIQRAMALLLQNGSGK